MHWLPALGISYYVGVDGISVPMVLMAGIVVFCGVLISWNVEDRPREFFAFLMFLAASVLGVFARWICSSCSSSLSWRYSPST